MWDDFSGDLDVCGGVFFLVSLENEKDRERDDRVDSLSDASTRFPNDFGLVRVLSFGCIIGDESRGELCGELDSESGQAEE